MAVGHQHEVGLVEELAAGGVVHAGIRDGDEPRAAVVHLVLETLAGLGMKAADDELIDRADEGLDAVGGDAERAGSFVHGRYDTRPAGRS